MSTPGVCLPAEWSAQSGILLAWPHAGTDWAYMLVAVQDCFRNIVKALTMRQKVVVVAPDITEANESLKDCCTGNLSFYQMPTNDTWARDFGGITVLCNGMPVVLDFKFNAWGMKFAANHDNLITQNLFRQGAFACELINCQDFVLEGGSIESDDHGTVLTTSECLLSPNRNGHLGKAAIEARLKEFFGATQVLWLDHGYLAGDDTDSHIDTLARFAPDNHILYVRCDDESDEHYAALHAMEQQLSTFRNAQGEPYKLVALPMPKPIYDSEGNRLPATYANFLIANGQVLVPIYNDDADASALEIIRGVFPDREVVGIDCRALIEQHGSLHCVTMQFPENVIK